MADYVTELNAFCGGKMTPKFNLRANTALPRNALLLFFMILTSTG